MIDQRRGDLSENNRIIRTVGTQRVGEETVGFETHGRSVSPCRIFLLFWVGGNV